MSPLFETSSWLEAIGVYRAGQPVGPTAGAYAPDERTLYLEADADVLVGDVVALRGTTRRIVEAPELWFGAGVTVVLDEEPAFPDLGAVLRPSGGGWDRTSKTYVEGPDVPTWSGSCRVTAVDQGTDATEVTEQMVTTQAFTVETLVDLVDVRPDDVFVVSRSADARLVGRRLTVTRVQAGSEAGARVFRAIDNQG